MLSGFKTVNIFLVDLVLEAKTLVMYMCIHVCVLSRLYECQSQEIPRAVYIAQCRSTVYIPFS